MASTTGKSTKIATKNTRIGYRLTCGKEVGYQYPGQKCADGNGTVFWLDGKPTRATIDKLRRPYGGLEAPDRYMKIQGHEKKWNLPQHHQRHLLSFPLEILECILEHCLVSRQNITPQCVSQNLYSYEGASLPTYKTTVTALGESLYTPAMDLVLCQMHEHLSKDDKTGQESKKQVRFYKRSIDATILRVSKMFHERGRELLYGKNTFSFDLGANLEIPQLLHGLHWHDGYQSHLLGRIMPPESILRTANIQTDIRSLMSYDHKADWTFTDEFLRFLKSIGPKNASYIKRLWFRGQACVDEDEDGDEGEVRQAEPFILDHDEAQIFNLLYYIPLYSKFIRRFCKNLEYLEIVVSRFDDDTFEIDNDTIDEDIQPKEFGLWEQKLLRFETAERQDMKNILDEEIPKFQRLKELVFRTEHDSWEPHGEIRRARRALANRWIRAADDLMVCDARDDLDAAFRYRTSHPKIVAMNRKLGYTDSKIAALWRRRYLQRKTVKPGQKGLYESLSQNRCRGLV